MATFSDANPFRASPLQNTLLIGRKHGDSRIAAQLEDLRYIDRDP